MRPSFSLFSGLIIRSSCHSLVQMERTRKMPWHPSVTVGDIKLGDSWHFESGLWCSFL